MITQDIRYGWRLMVRKPAFTAVAVLTLGLGIGANVTMFSWVESTLQRQIHGVPDGDRLVAMNGTTRTRSDLSLSYPDFVDYRQRRPESVEDLIAYTLAPMNLRTEGDPQRVFGQLVSGNFFDALGVRPVLGRAFPAGGGQDAEHASRRRLQPQLLAAAICRRPVDRRRRRSRSTATRSR